MLIKCIPKEGCRQQFLLLIDDEHWKTINTSIFGRKPAFPQFSENLEVWEQRFYELEYKAAFAYALKSIALRSRASSEIQKKLEQNLVSAPVIKRILTEFNQKGYLNDLAWVENFVRQQLARHLGPQAIALKLRAKGIPSDLVKQVLGQLEGSESQEKHVLHLLKTRYSSRDLSQFKERNKVIASLIRKGFSFSVIRKVINTDED
jgi:regulatory protein